MLNNFMKHMIDSMPDLGRGKDVGQAPMGTLPTKPAIVVKVQRRLERLDMFNPDRADEMLTLDGRYTLGLADRDPMRTGRGVLVEDITAQIFCGNSGIYESAGRLPRPILNHASRDSAEALAREREAALSPTEIRKAFVRNSAEIKRLITSYRKTAEQGVPTGAAPLPTSASALAILNPKANATVPVLSEGLSAWRALTGWRAVAETAVAKVLAEEKEAAAEARVLTVPTTSVRCVAARRLLDTRGLLDRYADRVPRTLASAVALPIAPAAQVRFLAPTQRTSQATQLPGVVSGPLDKKLQEFDPAARASMVANSAVCQRSVHAASGPSRTEAAERAKQAQLGQSERFVLEQRARAADADATTTYWHTKMLEPSVSRHAVAHLLTFRPDDLPAPTAAVMRRVVGSGTGGPAVTEPAVAAVLQYLLETDARAGALVKGKPYPAWSALKAIGAHVNETLGSSSWTISDKDDKAQIKAVKALCIAARAAHLSGGGGAAPAAARRRAKPKARAAPAPAASAESGRSFIFERERWTISRAAEMVNADGNRLVTCHLAAARRGGGGGGGGGESTMEFPYCRAVELADEYAEMHAPPDHDGDSDDEYEPGYD